MKMIKDEKDDILFNIKGDDIEFDEKDYFLKDNIDYYDDFLVEDKIQDLETAKENVHNKVRPVKPSVKTSFKPREKKSVTPNNLNIANNIPGSSNQPKEINSNRFQANFNPKNNIKEGNINPNKEGLSANLENRKSNNMKKIHPDLQEAKANKGNMSNQANSKINARVVKGEANLVSVHMGIIKEDATLLTEEGELVSNVKGVGDVDYEMDAYTKDLETIIGKKIKMYKDLKTKLDIYKYNNLKYKKDNKPRNTSKDPNSASSYD